MVRLFVVILFFFLLLDFFFRRHLVESPYGESVLHSRLKLQVRGVGDKDHLVKANGAVSVAKYNFNCAAVFVKVKDRPARLLPE